MTFFAFHCFNSKDLMTTVLGDVRWNIGFTIHNIDIFASGIEFGFHTCGRVCVQSRGRRRVDE